MIGSKDYKKNLLHLQMPMKKSLPDSWKKLKTIKKKSRIKKKKKRRRILSNKGLKSLIKIWLNKKRMLKSKLLKIAKRKEKRGFKRNLMTWKETRVKRNKKKSQRRNK